MKLMSRPLLAVMVIFLLLTGCALNQPQLTSHQETRQFALGDMTVLEIIDSPLRFDTNMWPDIANHPDKLAQMPGGIYDTDIKTFLVKTGDRVVLIDSGVGGEHYVTKGNTVEILRKNGVTPKDVTDILMTHLDIDHVGGLVVGKDAVFPNAQLHVSRPEHDAWVNDKGLVNRLPEQKKLTTLILAAYENRLRLFNFGDTVLPGIVAVDATGHTPGHTAFEVTSGGAGMLVAGDFMHIADIQMRSPEYSTIWDTSPQAGDTRRRILERLSESNLLLAGMHIHEIGHVRRAPSGGFMLVPAN